MIRKQCLGCAGTRFLSTNTVHPVVLKTPNGAMAGSESYGKVTAKADLVWNNNVFLCSYFEPASLTFSQLPTSRRQHTILSMERIRSRTVGGSSRATLLAALSPTSWLEGADQDVDLAPAELVDNCGSALRLSKVSCSSCSVPCLGHPWWLESP